METGRRPAAVSNEAELVDEAHAAFVALATDLDPSQMSAPSWCAGWDVRAVVAHVGSHVHHLPRARTRLASIVQSGFSPARASSKLAERAAGRPDEQLLADLASPISLGGLAGRRFPSSRFGQNRVAFDVRIQLAELTIHEQDIRGPLALPREADPEVLVLLLDAGLTRTGSITVASARRRAKGLRLEAIDLDWSSGAGPEVRGPANSLLLALSGRAPALAYLAGPGVADLARRVGTTPASRPASRR